MNTVLTLLDVSCYIITVVWLCLAFAYYHDSTSGSFIDRAKQTALRASLEGKVAAACSAAWLVHRIFFWSGP